MRADSVHVRHAIVEVNVVIGVMLCGLLVVRVVPVVVCDDAAVRRTLVLIAVYRGHCFHVGFPYPFYVGFCCPSVTVNCCQLLPNFEL